MEIETEIKEINEKQAAALSLMKKSAAELSNELKSCGAPFIGSVPTDGYTFDDSEAIVDGKFIGLPLDDVNEDDKTDSRIDAWIEEIKPQL